MHLAVLLILMILLSHDAAPASGAAMRASSPWLHAAVFGSFAALALAMWVGCGIAGRMMDRYRDRAVRIAAACRLTAEAVRWLAPLTLAAYVYGLRWPDALSESLGGHPLLADFLSAIPPLAVIASTWWALYPIDLRLRAASLVGDIDRGHVEPILSRGRYTLWQLRHQMAIFVLLLGAMLAWSRFVARFVDGGGDDLAAQALSLVGVAAMLLLAPLAIRLVWDVAPMPGGPLRDRLLGLCRDQGVRVRDLLLWRTHGGMINAAVIGFLGPVRYILTTDGLLEQLDDDQVEAVMAHELGHVRRRHLPWMLVCAAAMIGAVGIVVEQARAELLGMIPGWQALDEAALTAVDGLSLLLTLAIWLAAFGVVSRRIERQADAFAVQHVASTRIDREYGAGVIGPSAASLVADTLHRIARLNHIPLDRRMWRHGSIQSRIDHLRSLVGLPIDRLPIDRTVRRTFFACAALLALVLAATLLAPAPTI